MKKVTKKLLVGLMAVAMMSMVLVGCGSVQKQVDGDWTTSTINGKSVEEYAAETGTNVAGAASNLSIKDGKATVSNSDVEYKSDRAEVKQDGNVVLTLTYNKDADTLSYKVDVNGTTNEYVMKKGTTDLSGAAAPEQGGAEEGGAEEGGAEEGGAEEGGAEEGGEEAAE